MAAVPPPRGSALALSPGNLNGKFEALYIELEELAHRLGLQVILDKGSFTGGACIFEGEEFIVLNKSIPMQQRIRLFAEALGRKDLSSIYLKPAVRMIIDDYLDAGLQGEE